MSTESLTPTETLVLLTLLSEARPLSNTELKALGPELRAESRRKLNGFGLVSTDTSVRPFTHELTDDGWAHCRALLVADAPPRVTAQVRAVYTLLRALGRHLDRADLQLYEVFAPVAEEVAPVDDTSPTVEDRIRDAYRELAREPGAWVGLARLRSVLTDLPVDEVDCELIRMNRMPDVRLNPEMNQKALSDHDRAAAVVVGDTPNHLLSIEVA